MLLRLVRDKTGAVVTQVTVVIEDRAAQAMQNLVSFQTQAQHSAVRLVETDTDGLVADAKNPVLFVIDLQRIRRFCHI